MAREDVAKTVVIEAIKATPPVAVITHNAANGWTMTHTATAMTIAYVALQMAYLGWKWRNERVDRRARLAREALQ